MEVTRTTDLPAAPKPRLMKKHVTIWRTGDRAVPDRSWSMLRSDYKIKMDKKGNLAVLVPSETPSWYQGVYQGVRQTLSSTLHEWKVGLSYLCPNLGFSMRCQAFLQEHPGSSSFGLVVSCCHDGELKSNRSGWQMVGGAMHPKYIKAGRVQVRIISQEIEADVIHGEESGLTKVEPEFRGRQFDVQFACKFKGKKIKEGVFGKVVVEQICNNGTSPLFEFNLTKGLQENETLPEPDQNKWSVMPVRELASMLNILDEDNWRSFAFNLRFTEHEVAQLSSSADPFSAMLHMYQSRGGSPDQFMTSMYEVSRMLHVGGYITRSPSRDSAYHSQHSAQSTRYLGDFDESDDITGLDSVSQMGPVTVPAPETSKYNLPLTPPATPRKRLAGPDRTPSKRVRRCLLPEEGHLATRLHEDTADTVLLSDDNHAISKTTPDRLPLKRLSLQSDADTVILEPETQNSPCSDNHLYDIHRHCRIPVGPTTLWYVHNHVQSQWRTLGSHLGVPQYELDSIARQHKDTKERAYQVLHKWQSLFPEKFVYGVLYSALCDSNLRPVAEKYCRNRGEPY